MPPRRDAHDRQTGDHPERSMMRSTRSTSSRGGPWPMPARRLGLTGTHLGCEHGVCGACTVLVDGEPVRSCLMFAVQAQAQHHHRRGARAERRAASAAAGVLGPSRPAMRLLHAGLPDAGDVGAIKRNPAMSEEELIDVLSSNLCRCTGYQNIIAAVSLGPGAAALMPLIGSSVPRLEDQPLLRGQGRFAADISFPDQIHMRVVRSPVAHGRLLDIDIAAAVAMPGVVAVWTGEDVSQLFRRSTSAWSGSKAWSRYRQPILAQQRVRYVGEPVAVVFAEDPYLAEDAAEQVVLDIEELPPCLDPTRRSGRIRRGLPSRTAVLVKGLWRCRRGVRPRRMQIVELDASDRPPFGMPLETRARSPAMTPTATPRDCTAQPRCRISIARTCEACLACRSIGCICLRVMSAAASAFAASSIPRTCWSALRPCGSRDRSNGSRTGASISIAANHSREQRHQHPRRRR